MEQDNNNDKGAMETIKNTAKNEVKKQTKKIGKKILIKLSPYIGIFILCLLAIGLVIATISSILNFFGDLLGLNADSLSTSADATLTKSQKIIEIKSDGYHINDEYSEKILEDLESQFVDTEEMEFIDTDFDDMIDKYIRAEVKTMYPYIEGSSEINGLVKINRMDAETGTSTPLTYIDSTTFTKMVSEGDETILEHFSLDPNTYKLLIAYSETIVNKGYDGKVISKSTTIKQKEPIDYQSYICNYATPLNYFISMHMICQDKKFMNDLLDMVDDTEIVLTFAESTYKEFTKVDYSGSITTVPYETEKIPDGVEWVENPDYDPSLGTAVSQPYIPQQKYRYETKDKEAETVEITNQNISEYSEFITPAEYHIIEKTYNAGEIYVTTANTWRMKSQLTILPNEMHTDNILDEDTKTIEIDESDDFIRNTEDTGDGTYRKGSIIEHTKEWTDSYSLSVIENKEGYDLTDVMTLIEESYPKVKNKLETSPSLLFYLLEEQQNTQELASVMKYIIYKFTGNNYGITELEEIFQIHSFSPIGGFYGNSIQQKVWFALKSMNYSEIAAAGALGNIELESGGFNPSAIEDGSGEGIGLCQWSFDRREGLMAYAASKGVSWTDVDTQIEFLLAELTPGGGANGHANYQLMTNNGYYPENWIDATDILTATKAFCWTFERPNAQYAHMDRRIAAAQRYYEQFKGTTQPSGGDIHAASGDGFSQVYTSSTGRTYIEYKQWMGSHASMMFTYYGETIGSSGCSITSVATVTSGYKNNQTPASLASREPPVLASFLTEGGATCSGYQNANASRLTTGKPAVVSISGTLVTERGSKYYGGHYIAILDARNGNEVYVSDVGANDAKVRWMD